MASILILGGTAKTGSWFARYFREKGFDVAVLGRAGKKEVAERLGVRYAQDMMREVEKSDIVLVSVLIEKTVQVIREVAPHMHPGSLIMDVTSIKSGPVKAMKTYAPKGVEVLGTHPMFGPTMTALRGQTIILTPVEGKTESGFPSCSRSLSRMERASRFWMQRSTRPWPWCRRSPTSPTSASERRYVPWTLMWKGRAYSCPRSTRS